jgi:hypothetical protein
MYNYWSEILNNQSNYSSESDTSNSWTHHGINLTGLKSSMTGVAMASAALMEQAKHGGIRDGDSECDAHGEQAEHGTIHDGKRRARRARRAPPVVEAELRRRWRSARRGWRRAGTRRGGEQASSATYTARKSATQAKALVWFWIIDEI